MPKYRRNRGAGDAAFLRKNPIASEARRDFSAKNRRRWGAKPPVPRQRLGREPPMQARPFGQANGLTLADVSSVGRSPAPERKAGGQPASTVAQPGSLRGAEGGMWGSERGGLTSRPSGMAKPTTWGAGEAGCPPAKRPRRGGQRPVGAAPRKAQRFAGARHSRARRARIGKERSDPDPRRSGKEPAKPVTQLQRSSRRREECHGKVPQKGGKHDTQRLFTAPLKLR